MAWGTPTDLGTNSAAGSGATLVLTTTAAVPAGAMIILITGENGASTSGSVTDSAGNTYVSGRTSTFGSRLICWYVVNANALSSGGTITFTKVLSTHPSAMTAFYITGQDQTAPLDVTAQATGTSAAPSVTSPAPAGAGEFFVGATLGQINATYTQDTAHGWAVPPTARTQTSVNLGGGNQVNAGGSALVFSPTLNSSVQWMAVILAFKPAAVAGAVLRQPLKTYLRR